MLMLANHDSNKVLLGNEVIEVNRGEFITSEVKLMDRWGWSKSKVRSFLELLQKDKMLIKISDKKKTTIYIENYSDYQDSQTTKEPQKDYEETIKKLQKDTNNNVNNANNENKKILPLKKETKIFTNDDKEYKLAKFLSKQIAARLEKPLHDEKTLQNWSNEFNKMVRLDKYDIDEMLEVLDFSQNDDFWQVNILSAAKFRKKYLTLLAQSKRKVKNSAL